MTYNLVLARWQCVSLFRPDCPLRIPHNVAYDMAVHEVNVRVAPRSGYHYPPQNYRYQAMPNQLLQGVL